jgi:hypothetical protein
MRSDKTSSDFSEVQIQDTPSQTNVNYTPQFHTSVNANAPTNINGTIPPAANTQAPFYAQYTPYPDPNNSQGYSEQQGNTGYVFIMFRQ